jgi:hypothetical protein
MFGDRTQAIFISDLFELYRQLCLLFFSKIQRLLTHADASLKVGENHWVLCSTGGRI